MPPLINILTRTSSRPNFFRKCKESIDSQTHKNIRHIISIDNEESEDYVQGLDFIRVYREEPDPPNIKLLGHEEIAKPYNLYFNHLLQEVKEGWIMFLDDDDRFETENSLQTIVDNLVRRTTLCWKVYIGRKEVVPRTPITSTYAPVHCDVSTIGFLIPGMYANAIKWDAYSRCDWRVATQAYNISENVSYIDEILTRTQCGAHWGKQIDLKK